MTHGLQSRVKSRFNRIFQHLYMTKNLSAIVAVDLDWAIGKNGDLLCHLPADLRHFKTITMGHPIIMGRKTFESFPKGPLPGRQNIVVTRNTAYSHQGVTIAHSIAEAVEKADESDQIFFIGGSHIYHAAIGIIDTLHLTRIHAHFPGADTFFPAIDPNEWRVAEQSDNQPDEKNAYPYSFITLKRKK